MAFIIICLLSLLLQLGLKPLAIYCSSSLQHCTILYCAILYFTALYHIVLCYTVLYSTVLYCTVAVLCCTVGSHGDCMMYCCIMCACMLCFTTELSVHCTPPPSQPFSDANVANCSAGGGVLHTLTSQLMVPNTPQPYAQGAFHISTSTFTLETVNNLTLAVTNGDGTVLSCALLQTLHDVGASYNSITSPAITQRFPHYFATVIDNRIRSYDVLSDASSPSEGCMDRSFVFNPWGGDPAIGELSQTGVVLPNDIPGVPLIGSASIVARKVCVLV